MENPQLFKGFRLLLKSKLNCFIVCFFVLLPLSSFAEELLCFLFLLPISSYAEESVNRETLIVYYSRTGKSKLVCDVIKEHFCVDMLEVKDSKDREGFLGYIGAAFDNVFDRYTTIVPAQPDLSDYSLVILVSPIWNWKLSVPIRTFLKDNRLDEKKLVVFTTANIDIKKYDKFEDDAPFIKKFLRDYLRKSSKKMRLLAEASGAEIVRHYHVETKNVTREQIIERTLDHFADLQLSAGLKRCSQVQ